MLRTVIIDDESTARSTLRAMLEQFCEGIEVVGEADSVKSGVYTLLSHSPDLLFLDIQMMDGTGFDLLEMLPQIDFTVIFVTAHDQYALRAFDFSASGYLLKPVDLAALQKAVAGVQNNHRRSQDASLLSDFLNARDQERFRKIILPTQEGLQIVPLSEISRCEGDNSYTTFHLTSGRKVIVSKTLKTYTELLGDHGFSRIFLSHLVNLEHVTLVKSGRGGEAVMADGTHLPIARNRRKEFLRQLEGHLLNAGK